MSQFLWIVQVLLVITQLLEAAPTQKETKETGKKEQKGVESQLLTLQKLKPAQPLLSNNKNNQEVVPYSDSNPQSLKDGMVNQEIKTAEPIGNGYKTLYNPAIDLTPQAVAEYIILTGDFEGLDMALMDLVQSRVLTPFEVDQYKDAVGVQYEKMLQQVMDAEESYIQAFNLLYSDYPTFENQQHDGTNGVPTVKEITQNGAPPQAPIPVKKQSANVDEIAQDVIATAVEKAKQEENGKLDNLLEWVNREIERQVNQAKVNENTDIEKEVEQLEDLKEETAGDVHDDVPIVETDENVAENKDETIINDLKNQENGQILENHDNQGKMLTKAVGEASP